MLLLAAAALAEEPTPPAVPGPREAGDIGLGVSVGGGGLPAFAVAWHLSPRLAIDGGLGIRWGLGDDVYPAPVLLGGVRYEDDGGRFHPGGFVRFGATAPIDYTEVFVAMGFAGSLQVGGAGRHVLTFDFGPGYFLVRDIPMSQVEQGRLLLYARFGWLAFLG